MSTRLTRARGRGRRLASAWGLLLGALGLLSTARAAEADKALKPAELRIGFSRNAFINVNRNDVEAAFKALAAHVGRARGYDVKLRIQVFEETNEFEDAVKADSLDLIIVDSWSYLSMDIHSLVTQSFTSADQGKVGKRYLLLTRQGSGLDSLADLRGCEIMEYETSDSTLGRAWLETMLLAERLGAHETFFRRAQSVGKPSAAVLPVFFGTKAACVVDMAGFDIMKELNPQVGRNLQAIATSHALVDGFLCLRNSTWPSEAFKQDLIQTLGELHREPAGQQILALVKASQLVPFQEEHMVNVRKLRATYDQFRRELKP